MEQHSMCQRRITDNRFTLIRNDTGGWRRGGVMRGAAIDSIWHDCCPLQCCDAM